MLLLKMFKAGHMVDAVNLPHKTQESDDDVQQMQLHKVLTWHGRWNFSPNQVKDQSKTFVKVGQNSHYHI